MVFRAAFIYRHINCCLHTSLQLCSDRTLFRLKELIFSPNLSAILDFVVKNVFLIPHQILLNYLFLCFLYLKLELIRHFPASDDEKIVLNLKIKAAPWDDINFGFTSALK